MGAEKTITVSGRGMVTVVPDVTRVEVEINCIFETYDIAYQMAEANLKDIGEVMTACGLSTHLPKTVRFNIDKSYHSEYKNGDYTGRKIFDGYELKQLIRIDLDRDNALLTKVVKGLGETVSDMEINIGFTVRDSRPYQLKMLERAVKDATEKANIMASAAGCTLGDVSEISYCEHEIHIYSQTRQFHDSCDAACCTESSLDVTPEDLKACEEVRVTWFLSSKS